MVLDPDEQKVDFKKYLELLNWKNSFKTKFSSELQCQHNVMDSLAMHSCFILLHSLNRMDTFFDRLADDLETYAVHAKRKTIEVEDAVLLLKR